MATCPCARIAGPIATFLPLAVATGVAALIRQFAAAGRGNRATAGLCQETKYRLVLGDLFDDISLDTRSPEDWRFIGLSATSAGKPTNFGMRPQGSIGTLGIESRYNGCHCDHQLADIITSIKAKVSLQFQQLARMSGHHKNGP